ncbi:hypothetical protein ACGFIV_00870 [Sphaerisporangium sp. NPDC049003]|uniref:hypothetical protein n=1 Tax=Sphaerisporangium sp. NPDC049003 TaxID=3364517 RepID=UPI003722E660
MSSALEVGVLIGELLPLLGQLQALLAEPVADATTGTTSHHKATGSPAPWHEEAATVLLTIHEEARRLEASLLWQITGELPARRGGSDRNTRAALAVIGNLVHAVPERDARGALHIVGRWIRNARQVKDIGIEERWQPAWPSGPGELPPKCPYCKTYSVRVATRAGLVVCINRSCKDGKEESPRGRLERSSLNGDPMIVWNDGRTITYRRDWA